MTLRHALPFLATALLLGLTACDQDDVDNSFCGVDGCTAPAPHCEGDVRVSYWAGGSCKAGLCDYSGVEERLDCSSDGGRCQAGECVLMASCAQSAECPTGGPTCEDDVRVSYSGPGVCGDEGQCDYASVVERVDCAATDEVCLDGACVAPTGCSEDADCAPADPTCEGDVLVEFGQGTCSEDDVCDYTGARFTADCAVNGQICDEGACRDVTPGEQIDAVRNSLGRDGLSLEVAGATVTLVRPLGGVDPGFFVQAAPEGPALFVAAGDLETLPSPGDTVTFVVTAVGEYAPTVATVTDLVADGGATDLAGWVQPVTLADDLVSARWDYEAELISFDATLTGPPETVGAYVEAPIDTEALVGAALELRIPSSVADALGLSEGCRVDVDEGILWWFGATVQLTVFSADQVVVDCP